MKEVLDRRALPQTVQIHGISHGDSCLWTLNGEDNKVDCFHSNEKAHVQVNSLWIKQEKDIKKESCNSTSSLLKECYVTVRCDRKKRTRTS